MDKDKFEKMVATLREEYILEPGDRPDIEEFIGYARLGFDTPRTEVAARILFSDDAHCPGCGHNRDKSSVSTIALLDGRRECQMCGALWQEIERHDGSAQSPQREKP